MAQQTAVEWLEQKVRNFNDRKQTHYEYDQMFIQAKQMEKEQIVKAVYDTMEFDPNIEIAEKYYNKNYGK